MSVTTGDPIRTSDVMLKAGNTFAGTISVPDPLYVTRQNSTSEGGEVMLEASVNGGYYAAMDVVYDTFRVHSNGGSRFELNLSSRKVKNIGGHNDYAEKLPSTFTIPGYCVVDKGNKILELSTERLQSNAYIITDSCGCCIGEEQNTAIALSGRVKVYPYSNINNYFVGASVCSAPDGKVDIMSRTEIQNYFDRIVGIVDEITDKEIWIRVR